MQIPALEVCNLDVDELAIRVLCETDNDRVKDVLHAGVLDRVVQTHCEGVKRCMNQLTHCSTRRWSSASRRRPRTVSHAVQERTTYMGVGHDVDVEHASFGSRCSVVLSGSRDDWLPGRNILRINLGIDIDGRAVIGRTTGDCCMQQGNGEQQRQHREVCGG